MCEQLFCQLIWWTAFSEQMKNTGSISRKKLPKFEVIFFFRLDENRHFFVFLTKRMFHSSWLPKTFFVMKMILITFQDVEPCIVTLVGILHRQLPDLIERAQADRRQLTACLESLGCHGLVNCSTGLIRYVSSVSRRRNDEFQNVRRRSFGSLSAYRQIEGC